MRPLPLAFASLVLAAPLAVPAQSIVATVATGNTPRAVAVNAATNRVYVTNEFSNNVTVLDAMTGALVTTVAVGPRPQYVAVNPVTNKVYVANQTANTVTVIDGRTRATSTINVGAGPAHIGVYESVAMVYHVFFAPSMRVTSSLLPRRTM